tara:strand:+ start:129 stop:470 length:342 start_codon:yes stop_codon:yes gene_type:complete
MRHQKTTTNTAGSKEWNGSQGGYFQMQDSMYCLQRWYNNSWEYEYKIWRMNWGGFFISPSSFSDAGLNIKDFNGIVKKNDATEYSKAYEELIFTSEEDAKNAVEAYMTIAGRK